VSRSSTPLLGTKVDADRAVDEHRRQRQAGPAETRACDAGPARRGGEDGNTQCGELADGVRVALGHHHVGIPEGAVEVRGNEADHAVSLHDTPPRRVAIDRTAIVLRCPSP
jgi:hypothetical protein